MCHGLTAVSEYTYQDKHNCGLSLGRVPVAANHILLKLSAQRWQAITVGAVEG